MTAPLAAVTDHKYFSDDALVSIFNVVLKVPFFQNILWCSSDPQTLIQNHCTVLEFVFMLELILDSIAIFCSGAYFFQQI